MKTFRMIVERTVVEDGGERVEVGPAVLPLINAAIGRDAARMGLVIGFQLSAIPNNQLLQNIQKRKKSRFC
jgi:hypothetical protein